MPQNIRVAAIGCGEYLPRLIRAILDHQIIPDENLFLSGEDESARTAAGEHGATFCESSAAAVVKSEIVLVCASKAEMGLVLAPVSQCTAGRTLVTVCDSGSIDIDYVKEHVASGTEIIAATLSRGEDGRLSASYAIDEGVRLFLHQPCRDMVNAMCG